MNEPASVFATNPCPESSPIEYKRGWLVHEKREADLPTSWISLSLGRDRNLSIHPATKLIRYATDEVEVVLLGFAVDLVRNTGDSLEIGREIAARASHVDTDSEALLKYVAYLGGRFVCLVSLTRGNELQILTDCTATQPVYWARTAGAGFVASQHASLCARVSGLGVDKKAQRLIKHARDMRTSGTIFPPGTLTGYEDVLQVIPNHVLRVTNSGVAHERYYPFSDTSLQKNKEEAYEEFRSTFARHVELLSSIGTVGISLTAGKDSRATLAAARPYLTKQSLTWTYFNSESPHPVHVADLQSARALAARIGVRHIEVDLKGPHRRAFISAHRQTMGATAQMPSVPHAYDWQLPGDLLEFQSMAAEVGTGFYRNREGKPDVARLAELYSRSEFGRLPEVSDEIEKFIDYTGFHVDSFGSLDFHDFFYWEHRLGRWGSRRIQEVDLAHNVVLPFNSRTVLESLMSRPVEERGNKGDLVRFVNETCADLA